MSYHLQGLGRGLTDGVQGLRGARYRGLGGAKTQGFGRGLAKGMSELSPTGTRERAN